MVPKGVLVDREQGEPPVELDEDDDLEEIVDDLLMPRKRDLWSGSPADLVPIRMLDMAKLVFASDPAFSQNSPDRLVHDLHLVESGAWPSLSTIRSSPTPVATDSTTADADAKAAPFDESQAAISAISGTPAPADGAKPDDVTLTVGGGGEKPLATIKAAPAMPTAPASPSPADAKADGAIIMFRTLPGEADHVLVRLGQLLGVGRDELPQCGTISIMNVELTKPRSAMQAPFEMLEDSPLSDDCAAGLENGEASAAAGAVSGKAVSGALVSQQTSARRAANKPQVRARVLVDKILDQISNSAELSFDFVMMVVIAAILAAAGLATNNAVVIVASMLVSPLMSPVLALTFGIFVCDRRLACTGAFSELVGLVLCVLVGFVSGLLFAFLAEYEDFTGGEWPTSEMSSRGTRLALIVGVVVALASGCGVALGTAGNNVSGLVGVAISASLLPPIVNAGMLWAYVVMIPVLSGPVASSLRSQSEQLIEMGGLSLSLALVNIACILVSATGMFWIKEVAPIAGKSLLFSGTTAAVRRMYLGSGAGINANSRQSQGGSDGSDGASEPASPDPEGESVRRNQQTIGVATAVLGDRRRGVRREPRPPVAKPIGMERAIQLVVSSGWHQDIDISKAASSGRIPSHRKNASAESVPHAPSLVGSASAMPSSAALGIASASIAPLPRGVSAPAPGDVLAPTSSAPVASGAGAGSAPRPLPEGGSARHMGGSAGKTDVHDSSMTVDHRSSGHGMPHQLTPSRPGRTRGMRYPTRAREPHSLAGRSLGGGDRNVHDTVAIVGGMGGKLGVSAVRQRPRPRRGVHFASGIPEAEDEDEEEVFTVTRQLDLSDLGGRSMFGSARPRSIGAQIDGALTAQVQEASGGGVRQGSRMGLSEIMMRFAKKPEAPHAAPSTAEAAAEASREAEMEARNQRTLGAATSVLSQRRLKRSHARPRPAMPWPATKKA